MLCRRVVPLLARRVLYPAARRLCTGGGGLDLVEEIAKVKGMTKAEAEAYLKQIEDQAVQSLAQLDAGQESWGEMEEAMEEPRPRFVPHPASDDDLDEDDDDDDDDDEINDIDLLGALDASFAPNAQLPAVWPLPRRSRQFFDAPPLAAARGTQAKAAEARMRQSVLDARLSSPKPKERRDTVRQVRIGAMVQRALSAVLSQHVVEDSRLYPAGLPLEVVSVDMSSCLRYATVRWMPPLPYNMKPGFEGDHDAMGSSPRRGRRATKSQRVRRRESSAAMPPTVAHVADAAAEGLAARASALRRAVASRIRMKYVPELRFRRDTVHEEADEVGRLLKDWQRGHHSP